MPAEFRRVLIQICMQRPGRHIEKRNEPSSGVTADTEHERIPKKVPTRMNGAANDTFAHNLKSLDGQPGFGRIPDDDAYLRLRIEHLDVGNVSTNAVFQTVGGLQSENEAVARCQPLRRTNGNGKYNRHEQQDRAWRIHRSAALYLTSL